LTIPRTYVEGQLQDQFNDQHRIVDEPASSGTLPGGAEQEQRQLSEQEWHAAQAQFAEDGKITPAQAVRDTKSVILTFRSFNS
jgi:hypothetical protein